MKENIFQLLNKINEEGLDNSQWGVTEDIFSTKGHFGTREDIDLEGKWLYVHANEDSWEWVSFAEALSPDNELQLMDSCSDFVLLYKL